jgi:hypothetical protein
MLQETFAEWARLGNGAYFNASDGDELTAGLRDSVEQPYTVVDGAGNIVASGTVNGPPISIDAGTYRVVLPGDATRSVDEVVIDMEALTEITL